MLGICLGMQLAFESSTELGGAEGLGLLPGEVLPLQTRGQKLPHIGWNEVTFSHPGSPLLEGIPERCAFYHVHSLAPVPAEERDVLGTGEYGSSVRHRRPPRQLLRSPVPPREVLRGRHPPARQLRPHLPLRAGPRRRVRLYPAIDILDGTAVRLVKGDFDAKQTYASDPWRRRRRGRRRALKRSTS